MDLNELLRRETELARRQVHGNTIVLELDSSIPAVAGDEQKLGEVVRTLLENAIKSSPDGGLVTVTSMPADAGVEVVVRDEGVGVRAEFDNRLFGQDDLYASNPIRRVVGTGLGLGIARQVVEMHGGRFWVERLEGQGSEFHFSLQGAVTGTATAAGGMVA